MSATLGRLEAVNLRTTWPTEDQDFTPWLAQEENLLVLAETIGMELELEATEKEVGPFRADILCKDVADDRLVLIENQLERSDHRHLGQLLTYAAGLEAVTIVWVAARFEEQHRAAIAWLNQITDRDFRFFALEIELWRIGTSASAPKFNIVAQPNNWSRAVGRAARQVEGSNDSEIKRQQGAYWTSLIEKLGSDPGSLKLPTPRANRYQPFAIGRSGFELGARMLAKQRLIEVQLYIRGDEAGAFFELLSQQRDEIEAELGPNLGWKSTSTGNGFRIFTVKKDIDPLNQNGWSVQHDWIINRLKAFDGVFRSRVKGLDATSWRPNEEDDEDEDEDEDEAA